MVILGLLLLIVAVIAAIAAIARGDVPVHMDLEWFTLKTNAAVVFFLGAAAMLVFLAGWWMVARGMRRGRERRREVKALRKRAEKSEAVARREHEARVAEQSTPTDAEVRARDDGPVGQHVEPTSRER
jgi:membrane protein implicated in regulation of membrane protease activity